MSDQLPQDKLEELLEGCRNLEGPEGDGVMWGAFGVIIEELLSVRSPENAPNQVKTLCEAALLEEEPSVKQWYLVKVFEVAGGDKRELDLGITNLGTPPRKKEEKVREAQIVPEPISFSGFFGKKK